MDTLVGKFGGSSLADEKAIDHCANLCINHKINVVVLSAMGGITDLLLDAAHQSASGTRADFEEVIQAFRDRHVRAVQTLITNVESRSTLVGLVEDATKEFAEICRSLATLGEKTQSIMDRTSSRGERLISQIFAALMTQKGIKTQFVDGQDVIFMRRKFGTQVPDYERSEAAIRKTIGELVAADTMVVVPGFIGQDTNGKLVTLGRGGTDLSAAIIAASLPARELVLYKEVDGLMTANPAWVPEARVIPELHYREAAELAYYGAKILHPRTIIPLRNKKIPLRIRNTFHPDQPGTVINATSGPGAFPVKAISAMRSQAIVSIEGSGMMGVPGIAGKTFDSLAHAGISVSMISQASSEASICLVVTGEQAEQAKIVIEEAFELEIASRLIDRVRVTESTAVIAIVGLGMSGTPGIAARVFQALAESRVNIYAIAQGSSELNISCAVEEAQVEAALQGLHRKFRLEKLKVLPIKEGRNLNFFVFGFGQIGRTLVEQFQSQREYFTAKLGCDIQCVGLADSSGIVGGSAPLAMGDLAALQASKANGHKLTANPQRLTLEEYGPLLQKELFDVSHSKGIFVDCTAEDAAPLAQQAIDNGYHVVTANKKPLAAPTPAYNKLMTTAGSKNLQVRYEATVGAGLPILDTLAKLADVGDQVISITGCLSGTLGFLMTELEDGSSYSKAVEKAYNLGFTEPDPREDLSGMDVARKALILARTLGRELELSNIAVESLYTEETSDSNPKQFIENLKSLDQNWQERIANAKKENKVLRYIAQIDPNGVRVGIQPVDRDSPMGRLRGTDNQVTIRSQRYDDNPLIVTGPGAGAAVTAAGVLNDIIAIAAMDVD